MIPVRSAVKSNLTACCDQNLYSRALTALTVLACLRLQPRNRATYSRGISALNCTWNGGITDATAVAEFADPDVVSTARNVEHFQRLIADDRNVVAVSGDRGAVWWHHWTTAERCSRHIRTQPRLTFIIIKSSQVKFIDNFAAKVAE